MTTTLERRPDVPDAAPAAVAAPTREHAYRDGRDQPVFASETHHRARALRVAGWTLATITALWLIALVLGAFGLRPLPAIGMPQVPGAAEGPAAAKRTASDPATRGLTGSRRDDGGAASGGSTSNSAAARREAARGSAGQGSTSRRSDGDGTSSDAPSGTPGSGGGSSASPTTPAAGSATPPADASPGNGNSATAPGTTKHPDRTADTGPGSSASAPGAAVSDERRGGPKTP